ncbi:MAG TPA: protein-disulfide reductase DsbD domain-containing protein [Acidobacteriaceae bacterium]|jgi:hypothetical protein|nr:protein-disulfide reductase DsbD domain-containing protein [Acidobacteriaceae bacterium]
MRCMLMIACFAAAIVVSAQTIPTASVPGPTKTTSWVKLVSPQEVSIPAGKAAIVELHFVIAPKLHINSHTPSSETLIPTRLAVTEVPGLKIASVDFPAGEPFVFPIDPTTKLDVYTGEFVLKAHVIAQPGSHLLQGVLHYQACDNAACYPPKTLPLAVSLVAR